MRKLHLFAAAASFLLCLLSIYFGIRIFNANDNHLITELNSFDKVYYDPIERVPALSNGAAIVTAPFLLGILILNVFCLFKVESQKAKRLIIGLISTVSVIIVFDIIMILSKGGMDFSKWGYIWICLGLILLSGSGLAYILRRKESA
jgi:peptidoglycan/LPS O-acetylase OafA/YrhL